MKEQVIEVLDKLGPSIKGDGGEFELVGITDDGTVTVRMKGLCGSCTAILWTHKLRLERAMREKLPNVKVIVQV